jgi:hypothetical protein
MHTIADVTIIEGDYGKFSKLASCTGVFVNPINEIRHLTVIMAIKKEQKMASIGNRMQRT